MPFEIDIPDEWELSEKKMLGETRPGIYERKDTRKAFYRVEVLEHGNAIRKVHYYSTEAVGLQWILRVFSLVCKSAKTSFAVEETSTRGADWNGEERRAVSSPVAQERRSKS